MSLREALRATVACCAPQVVQHATTGPESATAVATLVQRRAEKPRTPSQSDATAPATAAQQPSCTGPAIAPEIGLAGCKGCRPYRLTAAEADAAHAEPWDDAACGRFVARVSLFLRRGIYATDADDLAERLHLRDLQGDDRRLCLECAHLVERNGRRCGNARAASVGRDLPADLATLLQRCHGFEMNDTLTRGAGQRERDQLAGEGP
jgi:hypothetical protein